MTSRAGHMSDQSARLGGVRENLLSEFRRVRDEIREWIGNYFGNIAQHRE